MPYGYHVFLTSFMDTNRPAKNLPMPFVDETVDYTFPKLDRLLGHDNETAGTGNLSMGIIVGQPMNQRLGTRCKQTGNNKAPFFDCLSAALTAENLTYADVLAIPESDGKLTLTIPCNVS